MTVIENIPMFGLVMYKHLFYYACYVQAHSNDVNCVAWNPKDSSLLASCSDDCTVKLWKVVST